MSGTSEENGCRCKDAADVRDGSVDHYPLAWGENVPCPEEEQQPGIRPCGGAGTGAQNGGAGAENTRSTASCGGNAPRQTDDEEYPIVEEA